MTINEQLIEKFKHEDLKEDLANGVLKAVRPNAVMKEMIAEEVRTKIVSLFYASLYFAKYNGAQAV